MNDLTVKLQVLVDREPTRIQFTLIFCPFMSLIADFLKDML